MVPKLCAVALIASLMGALLEGMGFGSKKLFATLCAILLMLGALDSLGEIFRWVDSVANLAGISEAADKALRAVGLGYLFGFTSDICQSLGFSTLSQLVIWVGKIEIFTLAFPYFVKTVELGLELLS